MGVLRNSIDIDGITPKEQLPDKIDGQLIEYSDMEHIYIPSDSPKIHDIQHITINVEITSSNTIEAPLSKIIVFDGLKKFTIVYSEKGHNIRHNIVNLELPFNTFIELPKGCGEIGGIDIYIADAYFKAIEGRKIYSYILYMVNVRHGKPKD